MLVNTPTVHFVKQFLRVKKGFCLNLLRWELTSGAVISSLVGCPFQRAVMIACLLHSQENRLYTVPCEVPYYRNTCCHHSDLLAELLMHRLVGQCLS